uniref:Ribosomal protein L6 n=1 Tax=Frullania orientalis TaxID=642342 RepID=A0A6C0SI95_9MARC|nr:ribosomal protein L6 [Frullania orientalis]
MEAKFFCFLEIIGVGYKASTNAQGSILYLKLGFSHEIRLQVTPSVRVFCLKPNLICCTGMDHQKVTQFAAIVKSCKPPEVYKGRGLQYQNEIIHKKQGKKK